MRIDTNITTIEKYVAQYPRKTQQIMQRIKKIIRECAPSAEEKISYGIPTFTLSGTNLVHFGAYPNHIGFYPTPEVIAAFTEEIAAYKSAKGSVQFPLDKPIPYELIRAMTIARVSTINI